MTTDTLRSDWGLDLVTIVCNACGWSYLTTDTSTRLCPNCSQGQLEQFEADAEHLRTLVPPEFILQYRIGQEQMKRVIQQFAKGIPLPPSDLSAETISERIQRVFLPVWMLDGRVLAQWQAEVGYHYQVESHKSNYQSGQWRTQKVHKTRIEWEERIGQLEREYANINAPALSEHKQLMRQLGHYDLNQAEAYSIEALRRALIRLPDRSTEDAFPDAQEKFRLRASDDIQQATEAETVRNLTWQAQYQNLNWSQLLLPVYMSYYQDDEGKRRVVFVNGFSGQPSGERRGSMKRAKQIMSSGLIICALMIAIALVTVIVNSAWDDIATTLAIIAGLLALASFIPVLQVWQFNNQQDG